MAIILGPLKDHHPTNTVIRYALSGETPIWEINTGITYGVDGVQDYTGLTGLHGNRLVTWHCEYCGGLYNPHDNDYRCPNCGAPTQEKA